MVLKWRKTVPLEFLDEFKIKHEDIAEKRDLLVDVARTSLRTKLDRQLADQLCEIVVDAVDCIRKQNDHLGTDLHMVEVMHMRHKNVDHA